MWGVFASYARCVEETILAAAGRQANRPHRRGRRLSTWSRQEIYEESTKTVALDSRVYDRLAGAKKEGESFSKAIDRILTQVDSAHTGSDVLRGLAGTATLSEADSRKFLEVVAENRDSEGWERRDLR